MTARSKISICSIFTLALPLLVLAQDQCNLLPVSIQTFPLYSLVPHTLNKTSTTLCEKYTPKGESQYEWIVKLINLAFTGDFVPLPDLWPENPNGTYQASGILDPESVYRDPCYEVTNINLVPYFNGTYRSNNRHGRVSTLLIHSINASGGRIKIIIRRESANKQETIRNLKK